VAKNTRHPPRRFPPQPIVEAAAGGTTVDLVEAPRSIQPVAPAANGHRRYRARLIEGDRWGSSGYYPAEVLQRDGPSVFPAGMLMYLDHPTLTETVDRPERSVRDLAARIATTPTYDTDGLYAEVEVFPHMQPVVDALAESIGLSIRAAGTAVQGEVDGRTGPVVTSLTEGRSVDFVTAAGAGGKLVQLLESAREHRLTVEEAGSIGAWVESRLHLAFTEICDDMYGYGQLTRDERITLSSAVGSALDSFSGQLESAAPQLYARDRWGDPATVPDQPAPMDAEEASTRSDPDPAETKTTAALTSAGGDSTETSTPGGGQPPAANPPTTEEAPMGDKQTGTAPADSGGTQVTETAAPRTIVLGEAERLSQLLAEARTSLAEATTAREAAEQRATTAERRALLAEAKFTAAERVRGKLQGSALKEASWPAVISAVCDSLTVDEAGKLDQAKLDEAITAQIEAERTRTAALLEAYGVGVPRNLGGGTESKGLTEAQFTTQLTDLFGELGMSEADAKLAAKGR
jgi:hypothetical protein